MTFPPQQALIGGEWIKTTATLQVEAPATGEPLARIARSQVETVNEVRDRLTEALRHIDRDRLVAGPDCGLGYLGRDRAVAKLRVLAEASRSA